MQFDANLDDVFDMARDHQLSKLFCRTDNRGPQRSGAQALKELMALTTDEKRRRSWREAQLELAAMKLDPVTQKPYGKPLTDKQQQVEAMRIKSRYEKQLETLAMDPNWQ